MIKDKQPAVAAKKKGNGGDSNNGTMGNGGNTTSTGGNVTVGIESGNTGTTSDVKEASNDGNQTLTGNNNQISNAGSGTSEVKEEPDETEPQDSLHDSHDSPIDDVHRSPTLQQHPPDNSNKEVLSSSLPCKNNTKSENGDNNESTFRNESCDVVESVSVGVGVGTGGVQPLASNVPKQPVSLDAQYMQQQSQIFVFSTALANKAAEAVIQGHFASIIAYHCSQPRTKKYLEGSNRAVGGMMGGQCGGNNTGSGPINIDQASGPNIKGTGGLNNHHQMMPGHVLSEAMMAPLSDVTQDMNLSTPQPLAGVKVPDENLTPQQRQHREEQLATLRKMQQILFPEALSGEEGPPQEQPQSTTHDTNIDLNKGAAGTGDWHKLQMQMYEEQKGRSKNGSNTSCNTNNGGGGRGNSGGPPPSYQQATRSASVPIALQSPSPASPNNTTSNLSLPSPRTCSGGINSPHPSDKVPPSPAQVRAAGASSNPPTPLSTHHLSPKHKDKMSAPNDFSPSSNTSAQNSQQSPVESLYCRAVGQKGGQGGKEPNLMPVPSPQQIQYLNTFEGQELTIQKQPNTSLKEPSQKSPPMCVGVSANTSLENVVPSNNDKVSSSSPGHGSGTPDIVGSSRGFSSDLESSATDKGSQAQQMPLQRKMEPSNFSTSPHSNERCHMGVFMSGKCGVGGVPGVYMDQSVMTGKCPTNNPQGPGGPPQQQEKELGPGYSCIGPDNVPLNPNRSVVPTPGKGSHFDPISSLAQMSQQLTNSVPSSPAAQPISNMHQGMGYNTGGPNQMLMGEPMHHMGGPSQGPMQHFNPRGQCSTTMGPAMSVSPKMLQGYPMSQRPMPRMGGYNGASIQVKPNAPNTIQYLPSRGQPGGPTNVGVGVSVGVGGGGPGQVPPRGAPSLDFLQRFSSPLSNLDAKLPTHNLQYFPNNYPQGNMGDMGMCPGGMRAGMRTNNQGGMLRLQGPGVPSPAQMSPIGYGSSDGFQPNCQLLGGGPGPGKGMAPDASQPLPPSMGQANNFKNSTFIGPTTADPNYAQQFHNFQQQLYATNTRGQLGAQGMPPGQHYFVPK
ncbi:hypothetical protein O3M35_003794 [Rhynocoris fuscipes]|uniref:B-cell lymphoma 9 beta-catenin binding domain-containing protein n=1 Tax=Rhynocoris fuscipes TaxID=488301 RepID=A0AAW1CKA5_9HEMI